jgi:hypothetical protein
MRHSWSRICIANPLAAAVARARGWSQNCVAILLLAHASWIAAESPQESAPALSEDLERKARFLALCAKNAPGFFLQIFRRIFL